MNDLQWSREGHDHGAALARELGFTPVYLHYNSGLHVSINGHALAAQLERLLDAWPVPVERLVLLGHSMGGLLARSALHYGAQAGHALAGARERPGLPRHAAPRRTARARRPLGRPAARRHALRRALRAPGQAAQRRHHRPAPRQPASTRTGSAATASRAAPTAASPCRCPTTCAATPWRPASAQQRGDLKDRLLGDGLVPLDSALGRHSDPARTLAFARAPPVDRLRHEPPRPAEPPRGLRPAAAVAGVNR